MRHLLLFCFLFLPVSAVAQNLGEVEIKGVISVPAEAEAEAEGITIYNKNTGKGSISNKNGEFYISASLNDFLYFSALQYRDLLVVVDTNLFKSGSLRVEITEDINELAEVVIRPGSWNLLFLDFIARNFPAVRIYKLPKI